MDYYQKDKQYFKFCLYGFLKNLRFYDAFLLLFFLDYEISYAQIGILYALKEMIINVAEVPSGLLADTFGRKRALVFSFVTYIMAFVIFYFANHFIFFLSAMIMLGVADAFRSGTHKGMIMDYLKLNNWSVYKIDYYGNTRSWSQKGSAVSALIAGFLVFFTGEYKIVFLFAVVPYLINFFNVYSYPTQLDYSLMKKSNRINLRTTLSYFLKAIKDRQVLGVMNSAAVHSAYLAAIKDYIQVFLLALALLIPFEFNVAENQKSGLVIGLCYFIIFLLTSWASKSASKLSGSGIRSIPIKTLAVGLTLGIFAGVFAFVNLTFLAVIFFILIFLVENMRKPILTGLLADNVSNEILTSVYSAQSFYKTILTALIALSVGFLADQYGIALSLTVVSSVLLIFVLLINRDWSTH